jgi:hypothetical protein
LNDIIPRCPAGCSKHTLEHFHATTTLDTKPMREDANVNVNASRPKCSLVETDKAESRPRWPLANEHRSTNGALTGWWVGSDGIKETRSEKDFRNIATQTVTVIATLTQTSIVQLLPTVIFEGGVDSALAFRLIGSNPHSSESGLRLAQ